MEEWELHEMMSQGYYESLSREERLRRVCALLSKAVTLPIIHEQAAKGEGPPIPAVPDRRKSVAARIAALEQETFPPEDLALFREILRWGEISPRDVTQFMRVSRATAQRRLSRLERAGWLLRRGATKAARYLLMTQAADLLRRLGQIEHPY